MLHCSNQKPQPQFPYPHHLSSSLISSFDLLWVIYIISRTAMALLHLPKLLIFLLVITCIMMMSHSDAVQIDDTSSGINLFTEALEYNWPSALYDDEEEENDDDVDEFGHMDVGVNDMGGRRSLFWRRLRRYYISYGVLFANRIPCPPRSGRSYYTHNCYKASGPAHPYTRGCSAITRCRS